MSEEITAIADVMGFTEAEIERRHPSVRQVLRWFDYRHLADGQPRQVSASIAQEAAIMLDVIHADDPELTAGLRKLLEAKDCFVRAAIDAPDPDEATRTCHDPEAASIRQRGGLEAAG